MREGLGLDENLVSVQQREATLSKALSKEGKGSVFFGGCVPYTPFSHGGRQKL